VYTDGSNSSEGAGVAWAVFVRGKVTEAGGYAVPSFRSIVVCELFALVSALRACRSSARGGPVHLFLDCVPALILIENMMSDGDSAEMWEVLVQLLNEFTSVIFGWVPGHMGILGNEAVDQRARSSVGQQPRPALWDGVSFGIGHAALARELRREEWEDWHGREGHEYYARGPRPPRHLRGLSRMDSYVLLRIRSGTGLVGHDDCEGKDARHHWVECPRYERGRPARDTLYKDSAVPAWKM